MTVPIGVSLVKTPCEQLTDLLDQAEELERKIAGLQTKPGTDSYRTQSDSTDERGIWAVRDQYLQWHTQAMALLPSDLKTQFSNLYERGGGIKTFLAKPTERYYQARTRQSNFSGYKWKYPVAKYFTEPFTAQRMLLQQARQRRLVQVGSPPPPTVQTPQLDPVSVLHPRVVDVSRLLFRDGHFRQAILDAWLELNKAVQEKSGRLDLDGTALMQKVFSPKDPVLKFEGHPDEQLGYMWMFSGGALAVRNPRAHVREDNSEEHRQETLELLATISAMFRALDRAQKVE
jgi:uncharacterized protein (TIGR02391 family)